MTSYLARTELVDDGWTTTAIAKWIGTPAMVEERHRYGVGAYTVYLYTATQVANARRKRECKLWWAKREAKLAKEAEEDRRQRIRLDRAATRLLPEADLASRLAAFKAARPAVSIDLMDALQEINREAKRQRDASQTAYQRRSYDAATCASREKQRLYTLKSQAVAHLMLEGALQHVEHHTFEGRWAAIVSPPCRPEVRLHVPCAAVDGVTPVADLGESIPARPAGEVRAKDAVHTVERYLEGRATLPVYSWPAPKREVRYRTCYECGEEAFAFGECDVCGHAAAGS